MSTPRPYQFVALRRLATNGRQARSLHMTGPATFSSPLLAAAERPASNLPRDIAGLRAECKRRKLDIAGAKDDLMARIRADDVTHSRAFTTAINATKRPSTDFETDGKAVRHFNTSRMLKQVNDSSTIDLAYLPDFDPGQKEAAFNVPIIRTDEARKSIFQEAEAGVPEPMKPEISAYTLSGSTYSAMSDVHDNTAMPIDFHKVAETVSNAASNVAQATTAKGESTESVESEGTLRQLWRGIVEDVTGKPSAKTV